MFDAKDMLGELSDMAQSKEAAGGRDEAAKSEPLARRKLAKSARTTPWRADSTTAPPA